MADMKDIVKLAVDGYKGRVQEYSVDQSQEPVSYTHLDVYKRQLPSEDELDDSVKDVYGIKKYIFTWMGHVFKIAGKKNAFSKLYEDEIARLRVERPELSLIHICNPVALSCLAGCPAYW